MELNEQKPFKITWTVIGTLAALVFGFAVWMTKIEVNAQSLDQKLTVLENIDKRLYRIEILLKERFNIKGEEND